MLTKEAIISIIKKHTLVILTENDQKRKTIENSTPLFARNGVLDSLSLVRLITDIEEDYYSLTSTEIILADEKAMSQHSSPFLTVDTLADYILQLQDTVR